MSDIARPGPASTGIRGTDLQKSRTGMDALPKGPYFTQVKKYPANPKTMGEAIYMRRLDLGTPAGRTRQKYRL